MMETQPKETEKSERKTIVVNLIGAPGAGKSTLAAYTFAKLKMLDVNCELVTEWAKDATWEHNDIALSNQIYVFANQYFRIYRCANQVDVIITDSPLVLSPYYNKNLNIHETLCELVRKINANYTNLNYFVKRVKRYNPVGRNQTEDESNQIAEELKKNMEEFGLKYTEIYGDLTSADVIIETVTKILADRQK